MDKKLDKLLETFSEEFYKEFASSFPVLEYEYSPASSYMVQIPAPNKDFGDIKIAIGFHEITILVGPYFHTHFEQDALLDGDTFDSAARKQIITDTIEFISDVIADKVLLKVEKRGSKLLSSSIEYINESRSAGYTTMVPMSGLLGKFFSKKKEVLLNTWNGVYSP